MPRSPDLSIGELSRRTGCNIETIRYYERIGLLPKPRRTPGRYRVFDDGDVSRLSFVRRARELGFALDDVRALLRLAGNRGRACGKVRELASAHLADVQSRLHELKRMERALKAMVASCGDGDLQDCPLIATLSCDA